MTVLRIALAIVAASGATVGCKGNDSSASIDVVGVWGGSEQAEFRKVLDLFEKENNVEVSYTQIPSDSFRKDLLERVENGDPPDVAILPQSGLLRELARLGKLVPIEDEVGSLVDKNYNPIWRKLGSAQGKLYGVWYKAAHKSLLWYSPKAFTTINQNPPDAFGRLGEIAPALLPAKLAPLSVGGGDGWVLTDWFENVYLRTAGVAKYEQLACHQIRWDDDSVKKALRILGEVWGPSEWLAGRSEGARATTFAKSVEQVFGDSPTAAMLAGADFVAGFLPAGKRVGVHARYVAFPAIEGKSAVVAGGDVSVILKKDDQKESRKANGQRRERSGQLIRFLATPAAADSWARAGTFISPNSALSFSVYPDTSLSLARSLQETELLQYDLSDQQPASFGGAGDQGMWRVLQDFLLDPSQVDRAAGELEAGARVADVNCK